MPSSTPSDRSRKRARSPSPAFDRYAAERRPSDYPPYSQPEAWDRERDYPAARPGYDDYRETDPYDRERERERALEWERYYRERDAAEYRDPYTAGDRDRYEARMRYDDEDRDRDYRRDRGYPYGEHLPAQPAHLLLPACCSRLTLPLLQSQDLRKRHPIAVMLQDHTLKLPMRKSLRISTATQGPLSTDPTLETDLRQTRSSLRHYCHSALMPR